MIENPMARRQDKRLEKNTPSDEDVSDAQVAEQLEQDPEEVPNATDEESDVDPEADAPGANRPSGGKHRA